MNQPQTAAGRELLDFLWEERKDARFSGPALVRRILAIEAEAHESGFNEARYAYDENAPEAEAHADTARPVEPLRLSVAQDGAITEIAGGPLEQPISTAPTASIRTTPPAPRVVTDRTVEQLRAGGAGFDLIEQADTARPVEPQNMGANADWPDAVTDADRPVTFAGSSPAGPRSTSTARPVEPPLSSRDEKATNDALLALHNLDTLAASGVNGKGGPPLHDDLKALLSLVAGLCRHALTARPVEPPGVAQETARIGMDLLRDTHDNYATYGAQVAQVVGNAYNEGYKAGQAAAGYGLVERHRTLIRRFSEHLVEGHWAASQLLQEARALLDTEKEDGA